MPSKKFNFTKKAIAALPAAPSGRRQYYYDTKVRGLALAVTAKGTKSFQVYRSIQGRPERITLGRFPDLTVETARGLAEEVNCKIAKGENPAAQHRRVRAEGTLRELFDLFIKLHATPHKKSWREDVAQFDRYGSPIASKKLSAIRRSDLQRLHLSIGRRNGHYAANRFLALIHTVFKKAADWGWEQPNPASGIKKFKETSRDRFLKPHEIRRFFEALEEEDNATARDYFLICLFTGARRTNVLAMSWEDVDLNDQLWTIPDTKNGKPHSVPLVDAAVHILLQRKRTRSGPWVFPGRGRSGHFSDPKRAWKRLIERGRLPDLRIHDLRRTLGSWQAARGASLHVISKSLGHKSMPTTAIYARLDIEPVRKSLELASSAILEASVDCHPTSS